MSEFLREARAGTPRIPPLHLGQDDQADGPFHQGADGRAIARPLDQVALPVARYGAGSHLGRALGNGRHMGDLPRRSVPRARGRRALRA